MTSLPRYPLATIADMTGKAIEQQVLSDRVLQPRVLPEHADSVEDALALAMEHDGGDLDMSRVAGLLGVDVATAIQRVGRGCRRHLAEARRR